MGQTLLDEAISSRKKQWTLLLRLGNVGPDNNSNVPGALYAAWNTTPDGRWLIARSSLDNDATEATIATKARRKFLNGYMRDGVWVSGPNSNFDITIVGDDTSFTLSIIKGVITINTKTGTGILAGALDVQEFLETLKFNLPKISYNLCSEIDVMVDSVSKAADVVSRAPQLRDPSQTCNAISLGLGLRVNRMSETQIPTTINDKVPHSIFNSSCDKYK